MAIIEHGEGLGVVVGLDERDQVLVREEQVLSSSISHTSILRDLGSAGSSLFDAPRKFFITTLLKDVSSR